MSPTARTLAYLRDQGLVADVVERWIPRCNIRKDCFGFADIAALDPLAPGVLFVQCTSAAHHADRRAKLLALSTVRLALEAGNRVQIITWRLAGARGKRKMWAPRVESIRVADFPGGVVGDGT